MSPSQGLSNKHPPLGEDNGVAPGARAEDVVASSRLYSDADLLFTTSATEIEVRLLTGGVYTEAAVVDVVSASVEADTRQS